MRSSEADRSSWLPSLRRFDSRRFIAAEALLLVAVAASFTRAQSDTYWHLAAGRTMVETGQVLLTDIFSHTNFGAPWANYEWLSQVTFYGLYRAGSMPLLTAACAAAVFGSILLLWRLLRGPIEDRVLLLAAALLLTTPAWSVRPQAFTLLLLMVVTHLVASERFAWLPPVFLLWANLHAAVALGFLVLTADLVAAALAGSGLRRRAAWSAGALAATQLTPLGFSLWPEVWRSLQRSQVNRISEWMPPVFDVRFVPFWLLACALVWLALRRWQRTTGHADRMLIMASLLLLVLAARTSRNVAPFSLLAVPALSRLWWPALPASAGQAEPAGSRGGILRSLALAVSLTIATAAVASVWSQKPPRADWAPLSPQAAAAIRSCQGPIYNHYDVGGYLIWFVPEQRVFLDSRQDPYPAALLREQREAADAAGLRRLTGRYGTRCAVTEAASGEPALFRQLGWEEVFRDRRWAVFVRRAGADG